MYDTHASRLFEPHVHALRKPLRSRHAVNWCIISSVICLRTFRAAVAKSSRATWYHHKARKQETGSMTTYERRIHITLHR